MTTETTTDWKALESKYYMFLVRRQPVVIERGEGTRVWDVDGKEYLDFTSGWAVNNVGHANEAIAEAISKQARTLLQTSNQFYTIPQIQLAQILVENSALDKIFICNSGAEANEGAIKLAKKYGKKHRNGAFEIITALNSFHGRTMMAVAATGQPHYQELFQPIPTGFTHVDYDDVDAIKGATNDRTVAVMLEPVQGEGGVNIPSEGYLQKVREWCDEKGLLLIFDEVQTGLGRLGTLFGYQSFGVEPDIMTLAKGLGGGCSHRRLPREGRRLRLRPRRSRLDLRRQCPDVRGCLRVDQVHPGQRCSRQCQGHGRVPRQKPQHPDVKPRVHLRGPGHGTALRHLLQLRDDSGSCRRL